MKFGILALVVLSVGSCSFAPQAADSRLPTFDPFKYVRMPDDPTEFRLAVRRLNSDADDPSRTGMTESATESVEKLGRPGFAFLAEEIRQRGLVTGEVYLHVMNSTAYTGGPLLAPALFEVLLKAKSKAGIGRLDPEIYHQGRDTLKKPDDQQCYYYVEVLADLGRNSVPYLCECLRSGSPTVRESAWDLLKIIPFQTTRQIVYRQAIVRAIKETDTNRAPAHFLSWWDESWRKLGWDPQSYSFTTR